MDRLRDVTTVVGHPRIKAHNANSTRDPDLRSIARPAIRYTTSRLPGDGRISIGSVRVCVKHGAVAAIGCGARTKRSCEPAKSSKNVTGVNVRALYLR
jgi:hypothetical protein